MGMTEHETEIYVRSLFTEPVNDIVMKAGMRAIFNGFVGPQGETGQGLVENFLTYRCNILRFCVG